MVKAICVVTGPREVQALLEGLCRVSEVQLRERRLPALYASGVRYRREPAGRERWKSARQVLADGFGDCEDLVAWRVAELRAKGERADPVIRVVRSELMHCLVRRADGRLEDPSKKLGMNGKG